jgi:hypothetical protein
MSIHLIYLKKGIVYVPTTSKVLNGGYQEVEPISIIPATDDDALSASLNEILARSNPILAKYSYANNPKPWPVTAANFKTYSAFAKDTSVWIIRDENGCFNIEPQRKRRDRGWEPDPDKVIAFSPGTAVHKVIERMIAILQEATPAKQKMYNYPAEH